MSQSSGENIVEVKPAANVYTALIILSIIALGVGIFFVVNSLFAIGKDGYGFVEFKDLFVPPIEKKEALDNEIGEIPAIEDIEDSYRDIREAENK